MVGGSMGSGVVPPRVGLQVHSTPAESLKASSLTSLNIRLFPSYTLCLGVLGHGVKYRVSA